MANETNTTTEILKFEVQDGAAFTEMEKLRKTMIGLKEEQKQLSDAFKKGDISVEEYAREITRVDTLLKKVSTTHAQTQKAMAGVQSQTDKLIKSNKDLAKTFKDSANDISVAGVGLGTLTSRLISLANPITLTVGLVGALGAAYARSTIGAKDLSFAQNQLSSSITILTNDFARLISSAEDGEGTFTKLLNNFLSSFGPAGQRLAIESKSAVLAQEALEDLAREELQIRGKISERLAENQELLTEIADEQTTATQKAQDFSTIIGNLRNNQTELLAVLEKQRTSIEAQLAADTENETLQTALLQKGREIEKVKADTEKRIQGILRQEDNIADANERQLKAEREKTSEQERQARIATLERQQAGPGKSPLEQLREDLQTEVEINSNASKAMGDAVDELAKRVEASNKRQKDSNEGIIKSKEAYKNSLLLFSSEAARFYQNINSQNKFFAAAQLSLDAGLTLSGIEKNAASLDPKQAAIYKAAAYLSAGASLAQAAKLIGASAPSFGAGGSSGSASYDSLQSANASIGGVASSAISGAATGAAIGSIIPGVGTAIGAVVGGLVGLFSGLRRRRRGYASGGWTGPGEQFDVAGVVHADEYVVPKNIKNTNAAQPHLKALENMRLRGYAMGGYTVSASSNDMGAFADIIGQLKIYASITDINAAQTKQAVKLNIVQK